MDETGCFLTQLQTFALLKLYQLEIRQERGAIVKTVTSTSMLDRLGEIYTVPVIETQVGFKYVAPYMIEQNALIGGEDSGGYGFRGHVPERHAIPARLFMLDFMLKTGKTLSQLLEYLDSKVGEHYYDRVDLKFPAEQRESIIRRMELKQPKDIAGIKVVKSDTVDGFRYILADNSWLLIRFSGTEPVLRVLMRAVQACRKAGATRVDAFATHGVLLPEAQQLLGPGGPDRLVVTDSILPTRLVDATRSGRLVVLQASALYGEAIRRIGCGESVVALRETHPPRP